MQIPDYSLTQRQRAIQKIRATWRALVAQAKLTPVMRAPVFELSESKNWGSWDPDGRRFSIHARLAIEFAHTEDFRDTVAHELAHQWVSEVLDAPFALHHGRQWQKGARLFGADPRATAKDSLDALCTGLSDEDERIVRKIKKLMALADSSNPHEAELAALRARELICRYQISLDDQPEQRWEFKVLGVPRKQRPRWLNKVISILTEFYDVEAIWISEGFFEYPEPSKGGRTKDKVVEITGTPSAVAVAEFVYAFLIAEGERRLKAYRGRGGSTSRTGRREFLEGLFDGFRAKLREQSQALRAQNQGAGALVLRKNRALQSFFRARYPHISHSYGRARYTSDQDARAEGRRQGRALTIRDSVQAESRGHALSSK